MAHIKHKIVVMSGKGGVGKSTVTAQLAFMLAADENVQVGVLDVDICGPSMPRMMGCAPEDRLHASSAGWTPIYPRDNLGVVSIAFMLENADSAVIWRGPKKNALIKQFLKDVDWGEGLDYLLIDTPPGTSDEHLALVQSLSGCDGAVLVTTPQEVSLQDVRKQVDFCRKTRMPILGVVENMAHFVCPHCNCQSPLFAAAAAGKTISGGRRLAETFGVRFLGALPLDPALAAACENGCSLFEATAASEATMDALFAVKTSIEDSLTVSVNSCITMES